MKFLVLMVLAMTTCGCTVAAGHGILYLSVLQKKSLAVTPTLNGVSVSYTTDSDPAVQARLSGALLLKADVTANDQAHRELLKRFQLFGPPGTIFFDRQGQEVPGTRVIGFQDAERFLDTLKSAGL